MLKIFLYCSYSGSPVGFILGGTDEEQIKYDCHLTQKDIPDLVQRCFAHGIIYEAYGKLPVDESEEQYLVLKKKISRKQDEREIYCNIAFLSNSQKEYCQFYNYLEELEDRRKIDDSLSSIIIPDPTEEIFGLTVDVEKLKLLLSEIRNCQKFSENVECAQFIVKSKTTDSYEEEMIAALKKALDLKDNYEIKLYQDKSGRYCVKKKEAMSNLKIWIILILVLILFLVFAGVLIMIQ
ncbi:MAG: hypothetical protein ACI4C1_05110 [Lachnospiraceae bacterium]